eukprot:SAG31_NODE_279_length_18600_cov_21.254527_15_plen_38_part_00
MAHEEVKNPWCDSDTEWYRVRCCFALSKLGHQLSHSF